jgi:hypothetical protein
MFTAAQKRLTFPTKGDYTIVVLAWDKKQRPPDDPDEPTMGGKKKKRAHFTRMSVPIKVT